MVLALNVGNLLILNTSNLTVMDSLEEIISLFTCVEVALTNPKKNFLTPWLCGMVLWFPLVLIQTFSNMLAAL